jgi:hypothetical protein
MKKTIKQTLYTIPSVLLIISIGVSLMVLVVVPASSAVQAKETNKNKDIYDLLAKNHIKFNCKDIYTVLLVGDLAIDIIDRDTLDNSLREGEIARNLASVGRVFDDVYKDLKIKCVGTSPESVIAPPAPN